MKKKFILFCETCGHEYKPNGFKEFIEIMQKHFKCRKCNIGFYSEKKGEQDNPSTF